MNTKKSEGGASVKMSKVFQWHIEPQKQIQPNKSGAVEIQSDMRCVVKNCTSNQNRRDETMSFHRFPQLGMKRDLWITALKLKPENVNNRSIVCSAHFHDDDLIVDASSGRRRLKPSAVPFYVEDPLQLNYHAGYSNPIYASSDEDDIEVRSEVCDFDVVTHRNSPSPECIIADELPLRKTHVIDEETYQMLMSFEREVKSLRQKIVENNRVVKALNTKLRFKTEQIEKLTKEVSRLKKRQKLIHKKGYDF